MRLLQSLSAACLDVIKEPLPYITLFNLNIIPLQVKASREEHILCQVMVVLVLCFKNHHYSINVQLNIISSL